MPNTKLSREDVAAAALAMVDRDGVGGLSMRRLADELGVGTMTLYGYFASKRELLDAVLDAAVAGAAEPELSGSWREQLRDLMMLSRRNLLSHPALVEVRVREPVLRPEALRVAEQMLRILTGAGLGAAEATRAFRLLFTYGFGFAAFSPAASLDEDRAAARTALAALPPDEYPALTAASEEAAQAMGGEEAFAWGLELILDGLETRL